MLVSKIVGQQPVACLNLLHSKVIRHDQSHVNNNPSVSLSKSVEELVHQILLRYWVFLYFSEILKRIGLFGIPRFRRDYLGALGLREIIWEP